jgi:aspartate racemase
MDRVTGAVISGNHTPLSGSTFDRTRSRNLRRGESRPLVWFCRPLDLPSLPLTANGKLDRAALRPPQVVPAETDGEDIAARTPLQQVLTETWGKVLGVKRACVHDNFFHAGGNSLLALRLVSEIEKMCGRHVSLATLFSHPSIAGLADVLETEKGTPAPCSIVELRRGGSRPPLYFPPGIFGEVSTCAAIMAQLPPDQPIYAIEGLSRPNSRAQTLEAMALFYCEELSTFQREGPLFLAGFSFSGLLAYEMARNLTARGSD